MTQTRISNPSKSRARNGRLLIVGLAAFAISGLVAVDPIDPPKAHAACPVNEDCDFYPDPEPLPEPDPGPERPHRPGNKSALVVSMGDSYASGEGAPEWPGLSDGKGYQMDSKCHRSSLSASGRAVKTLSGNSPYAEGIQHVNVSCTGATIKSRYGQDGHSFTGGLLTDQKDMGKQPQFDQVNLAVGSRPIDALTISIGGNDVRFAKLVEECGSSRTCSTGTTADNLRKDLQDLRNLYSELIVAVQGDAVGMGRRLNAPVRNVFVTKYIDPTFRTTTARCHNQGGWFLDGMTNLEALWAKTNVIDKINWEIQYMVDRANAANRGTRWHTVAAPSFAGRGFCSSSPWIHTFHTSQDLQRDHTAMVHPNSAGWGKLAESLSGNLDYLNDVPYSL